MALMEVVCPSLLSTHAITPYPHDLRFYIEGSTIPSRSPTTREDASAGRSLVSTKLVLNTVSHTILYIDILHRSLITTGMRTHVPR